MEALTAAVIRTRKFKLFLVLIVKQVVATFPLHCLEHWIKYGNPEVGNTAHKKFVKDTTILQY